MNIRISTRRIKHFAENVFGETSAFHALEPQSLNSNEPALRSGSGIIYYIVKLKIGRENMAAFHFNDVRSAAEPSSYMKIHRVVFYDRALSGFRKTRVHSDFF